MNIQQLQINLQTSGRYFGMLDGQFGPQTGAAVLLAMTDGPDTRLTEKDYADAADACGIHVAAVKAFAVVESNGDGDADGDGRPDILFEGHRFSRATKGVYDVRFPTISYPRFDRTKYPRLQAARYAQLVKAVGLNVDAGFASASYGKFQVLGENFKMCGYRDSYSFAVGQARDERTQLLAFVAFITARGIIAYLQRQQWDKAAEAYNGTAYRVNKYDERLAAAYARFGGK